MESKENPEEEEEEEEDEFFDSQDGGYDRRRKDSGFQGLSADVATGRMQRRGSAMMGLMDLWERVEKGEGKSEEAGGSGQEGRPGGTSTVDGRRDRWDTQRQMALRMRHYSPVNHNLYFLQWVG